MKRLSLLSIMGILIYSTAIQSAAEPQTKLLRIHLGGNQHGLGSLYAYKSHDETVQYIENERNHFLYMFKQNHETGVFEESDSRWLDEGDGFVRRYVEDDATGEWVAHPVTKFPYRDQ